MLRLITWARILAKIGPTTGHNSSTDEYLGCDEQVMMRLGHDSAFPRVIFISWSRGLILCRNKTAASTERQKRPFIICTSPHNCLFSSVGQPSAGVRSTGGRRFYSIIEYNTAYTLYSQGGFIFLCLYGRRPSWSGCVCMLPHRPEW
jgi:hypothetical protein